MYTILSSNKLSGITLHSGEISNITISKGKSGSGIVFHRKDLDIYIPANYLNVKESDLSTSLFNDGCSISTVEHFMSACNALNITDIVLSVDCSELPILDGSAIQFVDFIKEAKLTKISRPIYNIKVLKEVKVKENDSFVKFLPSSKRTYEVKSEFNFHKGLAKWDFKDDTNHIEILSSRTFGMASDLEYLRSKNLANGASLDNVIGIGDDFNVLNESGLRYKNEISNHKLLDAIGDLYLSEQPIIADFVGYKTGHKLNNELLRKLFSNKDNYKMVRI